MSLHVVWTEPALATLDRLDRQVAKQVTGAVDRLASTGHGDVSHLRPPEEGLRLRVRDWCVLFDIDRVAGVITVHRVEHRSKVYKRH